MAHFYGIMEGGRGQVTRTGHKTTGISAQVKTWGAGIEVTLWNHPDTDEDMYYIQALNVATGRKQIISEGKLSDLRPE